MNAEPASAPALSGQETRGPVSPLTIGLWLAVILAGAKAVLLGSPHALPWLANLAIASFKDVLFALGVGILGEMAMRWVHSERKQRFVRGAFHGFCALCAFYAVVAVGVFEYFNRPLSYDLLHLARSVGPMRSSISERLTVPMTAALIGVPTIFLAMSAWHGWRWRLSKWVLLVPVLWIATGWTLHAARPHALFPRLELNPHIELVRSTIGGLRGPQRVGFPHDFPTGDMSEFSSFAGRDGTGGGAFTAGGARPRNVIFIVLESTGTKYLSLYGSCYDTTPNLAAESAHALVFDNCYAHAPYTYHTFMAVNFSIYPGLPWCHAPWAGRRCPPHLASVLHERGWRTAYLHSGDLYWGSSRWMLEGCGFDTTEDFHNLGCTRLTTWGTEDRCLFERLIRWIDEKPGQPFFAFCWTDQTHDPYKLSPGMARMDFFRDEPPPHLAVELARYLTIVHEVDRNFGRLFAALRQRGLADDTLVVITGDHGEAFQDPHPHRGHGFMVNEEDIHVPLMLWNPRLFPRGQRVPEVCAHVDVNPTIADVLGVEPPGEWQGHSLFEPSRPQRAFSSAGAGEYLFAVRDGAWKYIFNASNGQEQLFELSRDPTELQSVAASEPERCRRLRQRIAAWVTFEEEFLRGRRD
jgi:arylsulfatase A-like enzyme